MLFLFVGCIALTACDTRTGDVIEIEIDGGGDTGNFNTTKAEPFPYNELEILLQEWEELNPGYKVNLRRVSYGGDQASLTPLLKARKAPISSIRTAPSRNRISATTITCRTTTIWINPTRTTTGQAVERGLSGYRAGSDGCLRRELLLHEPGAACPAGILYNKTFFTEHNLKVPETFGEFMEVQEEIAALGKIPYLAQYPWYNIILETNIFSDMIEELDVIRPNGVVEHGRDGARL